VAAFAGFPSETVAFLRDLRLNNDRDWFQAHRAEYERAYVEPARAFVVAAGEAIREFVPGIVAEPRIPGSIFRINRDIRFSKDRRPYKDNLDFWFWEGQRKGAVSGLFMRVTPEFVGIGAGSHGFGKGLLVAFREALADQNSGSEFVEMLRTVQERGYEVLGEQFRRDPAGYDVRDEARRFLRFGALFVHIDEPLDERLLDGRILDVCVAHWRQLAPMHHWLVRHVQDK
jgi:uncharacterized protein (TIGR02453 family)